MSSGAGRGPRVAMCAFANPFALSLRQAHLQRTGFQKTQQSDHGEHYSGWQPKIPRVNHLSPEDRVAHMHNVESRRRRQQLIRHMTQCKSDMRGDNEKARGPGVPADALDRWSRTRNLNHPRVKPTTKEMVQKDLEFIKRSKAQMAKIEREKKLPLPHVVSRNPTWKQMHLETMQRSFSALAQLESTGETFDATATRTPRQAVDGYNGKDVAEMNRSAGGDGAESAFRKSVTFAAATTDSIDKFWEQREAELFS